MKLAIVVWVKAELGCPLSHSLFWNGVKAWRNILHTSTKNVAPALTIVINKGLITKTLETSVIWFTLHFISNLVTMHWGIPRLVLATISTVFLICRVSSQTMSSSPCSMFQTIDWGLLCVSFELQRVKCTQNDTVRNYNFIICSDRKRQFSVRRRSETEFYLIRGTWNFNDMLFKRRMKWFVKIHHRS